MKKVTLLVWITLVTTACESYNQDDYKELVVVEAYAIANRLLPVVRLSTTAPAGEQYAAENQALANANIQVVLLDEHGNDEEQFEYFPSQMNQGAYIAEDNSHRVLPRRTYRLDIHFDDRPEILHAQTTIPEDFEIINNVRDQVVYQSEEQLELVVSAIEKSESQNVYVINAIALNPSKENLTPFYLDVVENGDSETEDFINNSSGLINEGNFNVNDDGTITLQFPWIGVAFFGNNLVVTNTIDKNLSGLIRSQEVQRGGSTLPPGEIQNAIYNVEGGIGIFGSIASDTVQTNILRPE